MANNINIGIIGLGTVGSAVARNLKNVPGIKIKRGCDIRKARFPFPVSRDPYGLIDDPSIDVVVEAIGGVNPAIKYVLAALRSGKHVVTSNKELIALHLDELLAAAQKAGVCLLFEGAVGGGIPILNTLRDELSANRISEIYGIVNGTTNYILSRMSAEGMGFSQAVNKAKEKGFAEANPRLDIEGYDAAYKAAILASVAFGVRVKWTSIFREGIEKIAAEDIIYADENGYAIKLLAIAKLTGGKLDIRVHPALVSKNHPLSSVSENFNAIYVKGHPVGELMFYGPGAGGDPTSSAVISDIIKIAGCCASRKESCCSGHEEECRCSEAGLKDIPLRRIEETASRYYIRLQAPDKYGVLAGISRAFARQKVSIAAVMQKENVGNLATIVILLHKVQEQNLIQALRIIRKLPVVRRISNVIRIL